MNNEDSSRSAHPISGPTLAAFLVILVIASIWPFTQRRWWTPAPASVHGPDIDRVFLVTLAISGALFVLLQGVLAYCVFRYSQRQAGQARYWIRPRLEKRFAVIAGVIIFGVDVTIFALGENEWFKAWGPAPPGAHVIEVMAEQFAWNFRYAGPDGVFGKTDPMLISSTNSFGIDQTDPANADDFVSVNQLHLPEGRLFMSGHAPANQLRLSLPGSERVKPERDRVSGETLIGGRWVEPPARKGFDC